jgi:hypothetical protein
MIKNRFILTSALLLSVAAGEAPAVVWGAGRAKPQEEAVSVDEQFQTRDQVEQELGQVESLLVENKEDMKESGLSPDEKAGLAATREKLEGQREAFKRRLKAMKNGGGAGFNVQ